MPYLAVGGIEMEPLDADAEPAPDLHVACLHHSGHDPPAEQEAH